MTSSRSRAAGEQHITAFWRAAVASSRSWYAPMFVMFQLSFLACSSPRPLATLRERSGSVQRDHAAELRVWQPAEVGAEFHLGDGVQTLTGASALLVLDDGSQMSLQADTQIRFSDVPPEPRSLGFDVETGAASLRAAGEPISIQTRSGTARVEAGASLVFSRSEAGLRVVVEVGRAVFGSGPPLLAGAAVQVQPDGTLALLPADSAPVASAAPEPPSDAAPGPTATPDSLVAVTARVVGRGASMRTGRGWSALAEGAALFEPGTELKLSRRTSVELSRDGELARLSQSGSYIVAPSPGVLVGTSQGSLTAGGTRAVRITVPGGTIVVMPEGSADLNVSARSTSLEVGAGEVSVHTGQEPERVRAGQRATLSVAGELQLEGRGLDYADVEISAGESVVIHDPAPPTAVRFRFEGVCPDIGVLELSGTGRRGLYAAGEGAVALSIARGPQQYQLRCGGDRSRVVKRGKLSVLLDNGTRKVAARAPVTDVSADGHRYTVLYQNRLPVIRLRWPEAPAAADLELTHEFAGRQQRFRLTGPEHTFESGSLSEGRHDFYFMGGGKVSRPTRVDIQFDNAAPTATLDAPERGMPSEPGTPVTVSGIALAGWLVQVGEERAALDAGGRFSVRTRWPDDTRALSVRISHPERGTHLYVRRGRAP